MFYILTIELNEMSYQDLVIHDGPKTIDIRVIHPYPKGKRLSVALKGLS